MCAMSNAVKLLAKSCNADLVIYDVGPNVGPLNRAILLDSDFFMTPVAADLFSLRALSTVGRAISRWIKDWKTVRSIAPDPSILLGGEPQYIGYLTSAFKVSTGLRKANPHSYWEAKIAPRVKSKVVDELRRISPNLVYSGSNKISDVKHFHSLAAEAQKLGVAIGKLRGKVNSGHYPQVDEAEAEFALLAKEILKRTGV